MLRKLRRDQLRLMPFAVAFGLQGPDSELVGRAVHQVAVHGSCHFAAQQGPGGSPDSVRPLPHLDLVAPDTRIALGVFQRSPSDTDTPVFGDTLEVRRSHAGGPQVLDFNGHGGGVRVAAVISCADRHGVPVLGLVVVGHAILRADLASVCNDREAVSIGAAHRVGQRTASNGGDRAPDIDTGKGVLRNGPCRERALGKAQWGEVSERVDRVLFRCRVVGGLAGVARAALVEKEQVRYAHSSPGSQPSTAGLSADRRGLVVGQGS